LHPVLAEMLVRDGVRSAHKEPRRPPLSSDRGRRTPGVAGSSGLRSRAGLLLIRVGFRLAGDPASVFLAEVLAGDGGL
jgi:hypothetical protein